MYVLMIELHLVDMETCICNFYGSVIVMFVVNINTLMLSIIMGSYN